MIDGPRYTYISVIPTVIMTIIIITRDAASDIVDTRDLGVT
jgi:hypothetical protein